MTNSTWLYWMPTFYVNQLSLTQRFSVISHKRLILKTAGNDKKLANIYNLTCRQQFNALWI